MMHDLQKRGLKMRTTNNNVNLCDFDGIVSGGLFTVWWRREAILILPLAVPAFECFDVSRCLYLYIYPEFGNLQLKYYHTMDN